MSSGWSRLEKTAIWNMARRAHEREPWRIYQAFSRVTHLHRIAAEIFNFDYDRSLDRAILTRCAVVEGLRPIRDSAEWLASRLPRPDPVAIGLIHSTESYAPSEDNRLVLLELSDFAFSGSRKNNLHLRMKELRARYPAESEEALDERLRNTLSKIAENIDRGLASGNLAKADHDAFDLILGGILAELLRPSFRMAG